MLKGHPKGLLAAALSNMGERFGYYIMNAVLVLFLCSKFGLNEAVSGTIYSCFYAGIYLLSLIGGFIADRTQNYKGTIQKGLMTMAAGYILLAIPITATAGNQAWLLPLTCFALFMIAFGNGLFKGNLQAIVGQMYDNFEAEAAKQARINEATGQVARFESMYEEYIKNPTVTKQRMFYEAMEEVLPSLEVIIDSSNGDGVQKLLPLEPFSTTMSTTANRIDTAE